LTINDFRLKEEYAALAFGLSPNSLKIRGPRLNPGYNPFDVSVHRNITFKIILSLMILILQLTFVTWSPGYNNKQQHNPKSFSNTQTDIKTSKLLKKIIKDAGNYNVRVIYQFF